MLTLLRGMAATLRCLGFHAGHDYAIFVIWRFSFPCSWNVDSVQEVLRDEL